MTRIDDEFEVAEVEVVCPNCGPSCVNAVVRLFRNGQQIVNTDGIPVDYPSIEAAEYRVHNKHVYFPGALIDLTDDQLHQTAVRMSWLDRGLALLERRTG